MIRPWNWLSRMPSSLDTDVMSTAKFALSTLVPAIVIDPVTFDVDPTAVPLWPNSVSFTRYRTTVPFATFQVPARGARVPVAAGAGHGGVDSDSFGGGLPSTKWK